MFCGIVWLDSMYRRGPSSLKESIDFMYPLLPSPRPFLKRQESSLQTPWYGTLAALAQGFPPRARAVLADSWMCIFLLGPASFAHPSSMGSEVSPIRGL